MGQTRMVPDPDNPKALVEGEVTHITAAQELPSYVTLEDGTDITHRASVLEVVRIKDRWDAQGNPAYNVTVNATIAINSPESLRKRKC